MHFEKKMASPKQKITLWPDLPLPLPLTRISTLSIDLNLKMSAILFVLRYKRYKDAQRAKAKEPNLVLKGAPFVAPSSGLSTSTSNAYFSSYFFAIVRAS